MASDQYQFNLALVEQMKFMLQGYCLSVLDFESCPILDYKNACFLIIDHRDQRDVSERRNIQHGLTEIKMIAELSPRASKHGLKNSRNQDIYPKGMSATIRQLIHVNLQR